MTFLKLTYLYRILDKTPLFVRINTFHTKAISERTQPQELKFNTKCSNLYVKQRHTHQQYIPRIICRALASSYRYLKT